MESPPPPPPSPPPSPPPPPLPPPPQQNYFQPMDPMDARLRNEFLSLLNELEQNQAVMRQLDLTAARNKLIVDGIFYCRSRGLQLLASPMYMERGISTVIERKFLELIL